MCRRASGSFETAFDHFAEVGVGGFDGGDGAGHADEDVAIRTFEDRTEEFGAGLRGFLGAGHTAHVGAFGFDIGDFAGADFFLFDFGIEFVFRFLERAEPAIDIGLGAAALALAKVIEDCFGGFLGVGEFELGGAHATRGSGFGLEGGRFLESEAAGLEGFVGGKKSGGQRAKE